MNAIDSSLLVYAMDPTTSDHSKAAKAVVSLPGWALNPTVVHETYHTLVFKRRMPPKDARAKLKALVGDKRTTFLNITKTISLYSLDLASEFNLGGRDALIVGCCLWNGVESLLTHDKALLDEGEIRFKGRQVIFSDPIAE